MFSGVFRVKGLKGFFGAGCSKGFIGFHIQAAEGLGKV